LQILARSSSGNQIRCCEGKEMITKKLLYMKSAEIVGLRVSLRRDVTLKCGFCYPSGTKGTIVDSGYYIRFDKCPCCGWQGGMRIPNKKDLQNNVEICREPEGVAK
jgi:hypothetical protein